MNRLCYRVIFNKNLGQLVVVSEKTVAAGKSHSPSMGGSTPACGGWGRGFGLKTLAVSLLLGLGMSGVSFANTPIPTTIIADKSADKALQPIILNTASGVVSVNIATPNAHGLSNNHYSQFDVGNAGVVLNNNRKAINTQLAGFVAANPFMALGEASTILNQVNSNHPSYLGGFVEVAGNKADVIIANPSGLQINGTGFINAGNVHLASAQARIDHGQLTGYQVGAGSIDIQGKLNTQNTNYTALIAKSAQVNAEIYAGDKLEVITGENVVKVQDGQFDQLSVTHQNHGLSSDGSRQGVALDVSSLGGMYAGFIRLIGTDKGFGVNNQGAMISTGVGMDSLTLDSQGNLVNTGIINAKGELTAHTKATYNAGILNSEHANISLVADTLENTGSIHSTQNTTLMVDKHIDNQGVISTGVIHAQSKRLTNTGSILQTGTGKLAIHTDSLTNQDKAVIGQSLYQNPSTPNFNISEALTAPSTTANTTKTSSTPSTSSPSSTPILPIPTNEGRIEVDTLINAKDTALITATGQLLVDANTTINQNQSSIEVQSLNTKTLSNTDSKIALDDINWQLTSFDNSKGDITAKQTLAITSQSNITNTQGRLISGDSVYLSAKDKLDNRQGVIQGGQHHNTELDAQYIDNTQGNITATNNLAVTTTANLDNTQGVLAAQNHTTLTVGGLLNNADGFIQSNQALRVAAQSIHNSGQLYGTTNTQLNTTLTLNNTQTGMIASGGQVTIAANKLQNAGSLIAGMNSDGSLGANADLTVVIKEGLHSLGSHLATGNLHLTANQLTLSDSQTQATNVTLDSKSDVSTHNATVTAAHTLSIIAPTLLDNSQGRLSADTFTLQSDRLNNQQGNISHTSQTNLSLAVSHGLNNTQGNITTNSQAVSINTATLDNTQGNISHTGQTLIVQADKLNNTQAHLLSTGNQTLTANTISNQQGVIQALSLDATADDIDNTQGKLLSTHHQVLNATSLNNTQGHIQANQLAINATTLDNTKGVVLSDANQSLVIDKTLNNTQGHIQATQLAITAHTLDNTQGLLIATDDTASNHIHLDQLNNHDQGMIHSAGSLSIHANQLSNNNNSTLSGKELSITANKIDNAANLTAQTTLQLTATQGIDNKATATITAGSDIALQSQADITHHGKLLSGSIITMMADQLHLDDSINQAATITLDAKGNISHANASSLATQHITINNQGVLTNNNSTLAAKTVDIQTNSLQNGGKIQAHHLTIAQQDDYVHTQADQLIAQNLSFSTKGSLTNQDTLTADQHLSVTANGVINHKDATISSGNQTHIQSQGHLINQGLINGEHTLITTQGTLDNQAGGRIYGTHLAIQADTLNNTPAKATSTDTNNTAPVIAARERLDIGVNTLNNEPNSDRAGKFNENFASQALITSLGSLHIGGSLDDNHHATGSANTVINRGATIESGGQMVIDAKVLKNENADYQKITVEIDRANAQTFYRNRNEARKQNISYSTNPDNLGFMPMAGVYDCQDSACGVNYANDSAIWQYFNITPPSEPMPVVATFVEEPELPQGFSEESCAASTDAVCVTYNEQLALYQTVMAPVIQWEEMYGEQLEALDTAIAKYNMNFTQSGGQSLTLYTTDEAKLGPTSKKGAPDGALYIKDANGNYHRVSEEVDEITVDLVTYEDRTHHSDPARMVAGGDLTIYGDTLINDKSQMVVADGFAILGDRIIQTPDNGLLGQTIKKTENGRYVSRTVRSSRLGTRHKRVDIASGGYSQEFAPLATYQLPILNATITTTPSAVSIDKSALASGDVDTLLDTLQTNQSALSKEAKQQLSALMMAKQSGQDVDQATLSKLVEELAWQIDKKQATTVSTVDNAITLSNSALYTINTTDPNLPVIMTDPAFTNYKNWLSSEYMLKALQSDPNHLHKRLSDGYAELQKITEDYYVTTGRHLLSDYQDGETAFKALMDNGITHAKKYHYTLGVALTEAQMANLTTDLVWLVKQTILVPIKDKDGKIVMHAQEGLTPKFYKRSNTAHMGSLSADGRYSGISAKDLTATLGNLDNNALIVTQNSTHISADYVNNNALIKGDFVEIIAAKDITNQHTIYADSAAKLVAGNNFINQSQTVSTQSKQGNSSSSRTDISQTAKVVVGDKLKNAKDEHGNPLTTLNIQADNQIRYVKSESHNTGGNTQLTAQNGINITTLTTGSHISAVADPNNYFNYSQSTEVGSTLTSAGNLTIATTGKGAGITVEGSSLQSGGTTAVVATGNVRFNEGRQTQSMQSATSYQEDKWYGSKDIKQTHEFNTNTAVLSTITGNEVHISSQTANVSLLGTNITANKQASISANQGEVTLQSAVDSTYHNTTKTTQNFYKNTGSIDGSYQETLNQTGIHAGSIDIQGKSASVNAVKLQAMDGPLIIGNAHLATHDDGTLKLDDNGQPIVLSGDMQSLTLGTVDLSQEDWQEHSKSYRGIAKAGLQAVGVVTGALGIGDGITLAKSERLDTKTDTQAVTQMNADHIQVGAQTVTAIGTRFDAGTDGFVGILGDDVLLTTAKHHQNSTKTTTSQTITGEGIKIGKDHLQLGAVVHTDTTDTQTTQATTHDGVTIRGNSAAVLGNMSSGSLTTQATLFDLDKDDGTLLIGAKNTLLDGAINQTTHTQNNKTDTTRIGASVHHIAVDTAVAAENLKEAIQSANHARKALENAQDEVAAGRLDSSAIKDYEANLAMATINVANAQIALGSTAATAAATAPTLGFSAKAGAVHTQSQSSQTQTHQDFVATSITAANTTLIGDDFTAKGLQGDIDKLNIDHLNKLTLTHVTTKDTAYSQSSSNTIDASISTSGNLSAGMGRQQSHSQGTSTTAHDTKLILGELNGHVNTTTLHGASIITQGGHYSTDTLNITTSQNTHHEQSKSQGGNIGVGTNSLNLGYNQQTSRNDGTTNNTPSGIVYINSHDHSLSANHTTLTGGVIAAINQDEQGNQTNSQINFTTNTLVSKDLLATESSQNKGIGLGVGSSDNKPTSISLSANNSGHNKQTLALATLGQGASVANHQHIDNPALAFVHAGINTDALNTQQVIKDTKTGGLNINTSIDTRVFSQSGRAEIKKEQVGLPNNTKAAFGMFGIAAGATAAGLLDDNDTSDSSRIQKVKDNLTQATNNLLTGANKANTNLNAHVDAIIDGDLTDATQNQDILNELNTKLSHGTSAQDSSVYLTQGSLNPEGQEVKGQANVDKGHTYLNINHIDSTIETLNHEIAHHNGQGETSATTMGKIGNFAYDIGTSLNQEDINTQRQTITPTAQTLQGLSPKEQLAIHEANQTLLDTNEMQRKEEVESGDEMRDMLIIIDGNYYKDFRAIKITDNPKAVIKDLKTGNIIMTLEQYWDAQQEKHLSENFAKNYYAYTVGVFTAEEMRRIYGDKFNKEVQRRHEQFLKELKIKGIPKITENEITWSQASENTVRNMANQAVQMGLNPVDTVVAMLDYNNYFPSEEDIEYITNEINKAKNGDKQATTDIAGTVFITVITKKGSAKISSIENSKFTPATTAQDNNSITVTAENGGGGHVVWTNPQLTENNKRIQHDSKLTTTVDGNLSVTHGLSYDAKKELDGIRAFLVENQQKVKAFNDNRKAGEKEQNSLIRSGDSLNDDVSLATATVTTKDGKTVNYLAVSGKSWSGHAPNNVTINGTEYQVIRTEAYNGNDKVLPDRFNTNNNQYNANHAEKKLMSHITQQNQNNSISNVQINIQNTSSDNQGACYGCGGKDGTGGTIQDFKDLNPELKIYIQHGSTGTKP